MLSGMRTIGITVSGDDVSTATVDMNFGPVFTLATVSISRFAADTEDGLVVMRAGILGFRFQNPDGSEGETDFPHGPNDPINALPAAVSSDRMTRITMQVLAFKGFTRGLVTAFFWE